MNGIEIDHFYSVSQKISSVKLVKGLIVKIKLSK